MSSLTTWPTAPGILCRSRQFCNPGFEAEVAFVLAADLDGDDLELDGIRNAVGYAVAAIEVCGSCIHDWDIAFADTVADNASAGVVGPGFGVPSGRGVTPSTSPHGTCRTAEHAV